MKNYTYLVGKTFGRLTIIELPYRNAGRLYCKCLCSCGNNEKIYRVDGLLNGHAKSCGCFKNEVAAQQGKESGKYNIIDYSNTRINNWLCLEKTNLRSYTGEVVWNCRCTKCNKTYFRVPRRLKKLNAKQCKNCALKYSIKTTISKCAGQLLNKISEFLQTNIEREYQIEDRFFDGYVPQLNLLIESDGAYWHSNDKIKNNDLLKENLAKRYGYNLIRLENNRKNTVDSAFEQFKQWYNAR